jgi:hypothetical protein
VSLVLNKNHKPPAFDTYLGFCDEPERGQAMFNFSGPDGKLLKSVLNEYFFHLSSLRVQAPTSAIMLPQEGWKAARMSEAQRKWWLLSDCNDSSVVVQLPAWCDASLGTHRQLLYETTVWVEHLQR